MRNHSKIADLGELNHLVSDPQISSTNAASLPGVPCGPGSSRSEAALRSWDSHMVGSRAWVGDMIDR